VTYDIHQPQTNDIVLNRSFAAQFYLGDDTAGPYFEMAFAHKPANQLAMGFDGYLTVDDKAQVRIVPNIFYHSLISSELSYSDKSFATGLTGVLEKPESPNFSPELSYVAYSPSYLISPFVEYRYRSYRAQVAYLKIRGGDAELQGGFVPGGSTNSGSAVLPLRYPFMEATLFDLSGAQTLTRQQSLTESLNYLEGVGHLFTQITLKTEYQFRRMYRVHLALQALRANDSLVAQQTLVGNYQNNDSLSLGGSYVF
jgi:hypothetical protein